MQRTPPRPRKSQSHGGWNARAWRGPKGCARSRAIGRGDQTRVPSIARTSGQAIQQRTWPTHNVCDHSRTVTLDEAREGFVQHLRGERRCSGRTVSEYGSDIEDLAAFARSTRVDAVEDV